MGYRRDRIGHPLDGLGYLSARGEGRAVNGALFCSTMFAGRAPAGHVSLSAYVGGARAPDLARAPAADVAAMARRDFEDLLGASGPPVVTRVRQWPLGLPQYRPGHLDTVAACRELERRRPGLSVTGNFLAGVSVAACVDQARAAASRLDGYLSPDAAPRRERRRMTES
jgi:oxygen-dependent protoporphyrinogen oxidase